MIARLIVGGIIVFPIVYARPPLTRGEIGLCMLLALILALCIPDHWQD